MDWKDFLERLRQPGISRSGDNPGHKVQTCSQTVRDMAVAKMRTRTLLRTPTTRRISLYLYIPFSIVKL